MEMVRHHHVCIQADGKEGWQAQPGMLHNLPDRVQAHRLTVNFTEEACASPGDQGDKIRARLGVIISLETDGAAVVFLGIVRGHWMIAAARLFVPKGSFREAMAEALPYPNASFDLVFLGLVLHESDEPLQVLQEAWRVTRNRVCILEWPYRDEEVGPPLAHRINPEELTILIYEAGFLHWEFQAFSNTVVYRLTG